MVEVVGNLFNISMRHLSFLTDKIAGQPSETFSGSLSSLVVINAGVLLTMAALVIIVVITIRARRYRTMCVRIPVDTQPSTLAQLEKQLTKPEMDTCCQRKRKFCYPRSSYALKVGVILNYSLPGKTAQS